MKRALLFVGVLASAMSCGDGTTTDDPSTLEDPLTLVAWRSLGGALTAGPALSSQASDRVDVWARCAGDVICHRVQIEGKWLDGWEYGAGSPAGGAKSAPAAYSRGPGLVDIVVRGADNGLWMRSWSDAAGWAAWVSLGKPGGTVNITTEATISSQQPGRLDLWARGADGLVWHNVVIGSTSLGWEYGAGAPSGGIVYAPAAISRVTGEVDIVAVGIDNQVYYRHWDDTRGWSSNPGSSNGWDLVSAPKGPSALWGVAVSAQRPGNALEVWALGNDRSLWHAGLFAGNYWSEWDARASIPGGGLYSKPAVLSWTSGRTDIALIGASKGLRYRTGDFVTPQASSAAAHYKQLTFPSTAGGLWENSSLAVPPNRASCGPNGAYFIGLGGMAAVWKADLACLSSSDTKCAGKVSNLASPVFANARDNVAGASDQQLTRLTDGTLLLLHQGIRTDADGTHPRGVEYLYVSSDCGGSWRVRSVIDPKDASYAGGAYYNANTQGGFDRPELYADPWNGNVYVAVNGDGLADSKSLLYVSTDKGLHWSLVTSGSPARSPITRAAIGPTVLTSTPSGNVYLFACKQASDGGTPDRFQPMISVYNPATRVISAEQVIAWYDCSNLRNQLGRDGEGSQAITRVATNSAGDFVRVFYPTMEWYGGADGGYRQSVRVSALRFDGAGMKVVDTTTLRASSSTGSIIMATPVETDGLELASANRASAAFVYWYETTTTNQGAASAAAFGLVTARGRAVRDLLQWSSTTTLAYGSPIKEKRWSGFNLPGDYQKGAAYLDATGQLKFVAQWAEPAAANELHTNVVTVAP